MWLYDPPWTIIKGNNSDRVLWSQQLYRSNCGLFGQRYFVAIHTAGAINYEDQPEGRNLPLPFRFHRHRKQFLYRRLEVAAHSVAVFTPYHHKTDPVGTNSLLNQVHLFAPYLITRYIVKNNSVISGVFHHIQGQHFRLGNLILNQSGF
ncbi:hypothetical protein D3C73_1120780 [compost metagenome]